MNDKERILSAVISNIIPGIMHNLPNREKYIENCILRTERLQPGDLVFAATTLYPNNYSVGFVHKVNEDCVTIRKIGSEKLCNYYNEGFYKINKDKLGYEILEGLQYKIYQKVLKAFRYTNYCTRLKQYHLTETNVLYNREPCLKMICSLRFLLILTRKQP